jgi:hypothetical protein
MFEKNKIICIDLDSPDCISGISVKKNNVNFSIKIKETLEKDGVGKFVWFLHVELPKKKEYKLLAYNTKPQNGFTKCQEEALIFLNNLNSDFYKMLKEKLDD